MYYNKYLKYKNKYLQLKNQLGGAHDEYHFDLRDWTQLSNTGQRNCGIFTSTKHPKYIVKCIQSSYDNIKTIFDAIKIINQKIKLFPSIIDLTPIMSDDVVRKENTYLTMEKLDGDITSIYFDLFPRKVLELMNTDGLINEIQKDILFTLFVSKYSSIMKYDSNKLSLDIDKFMLDCIKDNEIHKLYIEYLQDDPEKKRYTRTTFTIKDITYERRNLSIEKVKFDILQKSIEKIKEMEKHNITVDLYDTFISNLTELWSSYYEIIAKEIIKIKLLLSKFDYMHNDNKYDNYGYILSDIPITDIDTQRGYKAPKLFNKYLYVYFLDFDSSVVPFMKDYNTKDDYLKRIIKVVNEGHQYSIHGQSNMKHMNENIVNIDKSVNVTEIGINLTSEILQILGKTYKFDILPFTHKFRTIEDIYAYLYISEIITK
jgi:hypothetical protein